MYPKAPHGTKLCQVASCMPPALGCQVVGACCEDVGDTRAGPHGRIEMESYLVISLAGIYGSLLQSSAILVTQLLWLLSSCSYLLISFYSSLSSLHLSDSAASHVWPPLDFYLLIYSRRFLLSAQLSNLWFSLCLTFKLPKREPLACAASH